MRKPGFEWRATRLSGVETFTASCNRHSTLTINSCSQTYTYII